MNGWFRVTTHRAMCFMDPEHGYRVEFEEPPRGPLSVCDDCFVPYMLRAGGLKCDALSARFVGWCDVCLKDGRVRKVVVPNE